ncbi:D-alanyl-D-alanine carboxypeptidase/D-alanyl-D-alanine-endopeptidase [Streptomyces xiaopingdaonensis]|uniref:D-alanyl-D-alanine carboxypeptidase/D-alanyl-D-alanine endopeptidase n=1 Tax=Streptomyces xiaopingdaonensis TaxID=1565415 RepID=UPI001ED98087|nr:D-alanyl-D-alanine carboxypeptidase/D-alanyl-D-alanine-endopeptidase [Streptomyces xiaopingdaonensis]
MRDTTSVERAVERCVRRVRGAARTSAAGLRDGRDRARRRLRDATPQQRQTLALATGSATLGLLVAVTAVAATGPWDSGQRTAERVRAAGREETSGAHHTGAEQGRGTLRTPEVLAAVGPLEKAGAGARTPGRADSVPPPTASALADTLEPLLDDPALGPSPSASVHDASSGKQLFGIAEGRAATPASTVKLATATAALSARGADHRITTKAVVDGGRVVLVGGGDPTLTRGQLDALAERSAADLRERGRKKVDLGYDTTRYSGTRQHSIGPNDNLAPVTPLMVEEGRLDGSRKGPAPRSDDPAGEAAARFAEQLEDHGVRVEGPASHHKAPKGAETLAAHRSAPLSELVERMLTNSDNDIAEALARQTALDSRKSADFEAGGRAVAAELRKLGVPVKRAEFADGSGLDRADKVSASLLSRLLVTAADPDRAHLRSVLTGLPVAGFTGTLDDRYDDADGKGGAGLVRAKTGTLTGVNTLAGTVVDAEGRLLAFSFLTHGAKDPQAAQRALDRVASALANCGCHDSPSAR